MHIASLNELLCALYFTLHWAKIRTRLRLAWRLASGLLL